MVRRTIALTLALVGAAVMLTACGGGDTGSTQPTASSTGATGGGALTIDGIVANDHGSADIADEQSVELEADDFYFAPTVLKGSAGQTITIELKNEGSASHTFTIEDLGIDEELSPGDRVEVEVTLPDSGSLPFVCRFHQRSGMVGEFTVS